MIYYTRQSHSEFAECGVASALKNRDYKDFTDIIQEETVDKKYILRRLTPTECARLQGFPIGGATVQTDLIPHSISSGETALLFRV